MLLYNILVLFCGNPEVLNSLDKAYEKCRYCQINSCSLWKFHISDITKYYFNFIIISYY